MKKMLFLIIVSTLCSFKSFAWRYKVQQCEIETVTNNCCFKLWVSIDKVDDNGQFLSHVVAGYVYMGCCANLPVHDANIENTSCADQYNGEYFYTDKSSAACFVPVISDPACYPQYTSARDAAVNEWKRTH